MSPFRFQPGFSISRTTFAALLRSLFLPLSVLLLAAAFFACGKEASAATSLTEMNATMSVSQEMQGQSADTATDHAPAALAQDAIAKNQAEADKKKAEAQGKRAQQNGWWGPGGYLSITKLLLFILVFFGWVYTTDWVSADSERLKLPDRLTWISVNVFVYLGVGSIAFYLPVKTPILFYITYPITVLSWWIPAMLYVSHRNKPLPPFERVLTGNHLKYCFAVLMSKFGVKIAVRKPLSYEGGPPIELEASDKDLDQQTLTARTVLSRNDPGFNELRRIIFNALDRKADGIMFDFQAEETIVREQIDGVWIDVAPLNAEAGANLKNSGKYLIGGRIEETRARQQGLFTAIIKKKTKFDAELTFQGTAAGIEKGIISFIRQKVPYDSLDQLGMRSETQAKVKTLIDSPDGLIVFSAAPANGLRTTMNVVAKTVDRFTREYVTVEDVQNPYEYVENVNLNQYDSRKGEGPNSILPDVFFREPQVLLLRDLVNLESFQMCCEDIAKNERMIITTTRAKDASDALMRLLATKISPQLFASSVKGVVSQRLIRKLCPDCKEVFDPQPALLQKLGLPPDRVSQLYRVRSEPQPGEKRKPCETCNDIGYKGRLALFEVLEINDEIRRILVANPSYEAIRKASVQSGNRGFMFEGALLVAKGITSVEELARVMKM